ncbi:NAD(+) kinase [Thioalkalivibrio thiocyanodenitrificans]|uniref:NAD(+) kinase n=1 Tax=Thioalkalivibrio thiocyanodenitrificans TaxID=243063 RepID=UPI00035FB0A3|nr:NAD(+) kinase [Thioalkalivibrio thiocyanodenitrificans]
MGKPHFGTVGIITKRSDERLVHILVSLIDHLLGHGCRVLLDDSARGWLENDHGCEQVDLDALGQQADLAIVIGGDGTFLAAGRAMVDHQVPLMGINIGRLGFLVDVSPHEMISRLDEILAGEYDEDHRSLLATRVVTNGAEPVERLSLNDVVLHIHDVVRMIEFETRIDGRHVNTQRADGLVVASPTGSTAYALSGGGPILAPSLDALVLVPICPHGLSNRPLVVHGDSEVEIRVCEFNRRHAHAAFDGQNSTTLGPGDRLIVRRKKTRLRLIHPTGYDYLQILRAKLGWGEQP